MKRTTTPVFESTMNEVTPARPLIRRAYPDDLPALERLIELAVLGLQGRDYDERVLPSALRNKLLAVDPQLIADGTYFVAEMEGQIVGGGGWSRRRKIVNDGGSDLGDDDMLDSETEAAKIRAFFVHPDRARLGIGSRLLRASEEATQRAGFRRLELMSTLTGVPLYAARGWHSHEHLEIPLPDRPVYPAIRMTKAVGDVSDHAYAA
jgi:GNAT superfamily N-acetyltransferase